MTINLNSDFEVLVATLSGEAEGETTDGKEAVAASIMNRVALARVHPHFGDGTVRAACLYPKQFSCWNPGPDHDRIMALDLAHPSPALQDCMDIARDAIAGALKDRTGGADYYFAISIPAPAWVVGARFKGQFGSQIFWGSVK